MEFDIEKSIEKVRVVDENRRYWFIRTYGGATYTDFIEHNYVGIGFNDVPQKYIENCKGRNDSDIKNLREYIESKYSYRNGTTSKWINQLIDFQHTIKEGDIVVIPDRNSDQFTVGVVESDVYVVEDNRAFLHNKNYEPYPEKRRKIKWQRNIIGSDTRELKGLTNSRQAISRADNYADIIEGFVSSVYIREDQMHLVLKINQHEDINAFDLNDMLSGVTYFYNEFCKEYGIPENRDLTIKIQVQSEGNARVKGYFKKGIFGVMIITALTANGEFTMDPATGEFSFKTGDGIVSSILEPITDFLNAKQERTIKFIEYQKSSKNLELNSLNTNNNVLDNTTEEGEGKNANDEGN
ncbi:MAG: hypothetical protein V7719_09615 [Psychroserpens sp.]|uniref:hypothetical protein n=1 Tax=Psychroserpens sp. TaxID=2020870 RepID=UPI003001BB7E